MKLIKIILLLIVTVLFLDAAETQVDETVNKYISDTQPTNTKDNPVLECPMMRPEYIARVDRYDFSTGKTYCKVYKIDANTGVPSDSAEAIVENYNEYAKDFYNYVSDAERKEIDARLQAKWKKLGKNIASSEELKALQDKYFKNYINTGDSEFLTGSKYLLAGITMDGERINIKESIERNDVVLNPGYTIYPNDSTTLKEAGMLETLWNMFLGGDSIKNFVKNETIETQELQTQAKQMLSNLIVFIMDFFAELNEVYNDVNFIVMGSVLPMTLLFGMQKGLTSKLSKIQHHDDYWERLILGVIVFGFFYMGTTNYTIDKMEDKAIDQTQFQNSSRILLYQGVDWADEATRAMAKSYVSFKMKDAGILGQEQSKKLEYEIATKEKKRAELSSLITKKCFEYYDVDKIKAEANMGPNQYFSSDQSIYDYAYLNSSYSGMDKSANGAIKEVPTINACYNIVRDYQLLNTEVKEAKLKLADYDGILEGNGIAERMNLVAEYIYKNTADNGFIAAPMIGASNIFLDGIEAFMTKQKEELVDSKKPEDLSNSFESTNFGINSMNWITDKAVYMMVAGASSLRETIFSAVKGISGMEKTSIAASLVMSVIIVSTMIKYAPILAMISASILVIVFYYISVEIFYLVSPFIVVYAFATNQQTYIISLLARFLALALKPLMIVLSIALAMLAIKIFEGINTSMVSVSFDMFQQILHVDLGTGLSYIKNFVYDSGSMLGISFMGSVIKLLVQIFATLGVFYIVFNGADMFLKMLGFKEAGIDVQESIGREIEGGSSRYSKPV